MLQREETSACATSSLAKCSDDFKSPDNKLQYANVGDYEFGDFFSFLLPVGVIIHKWVQVARVTTLVTVTCSKHLSGGHVY